MFLYLSPSCPIFSPENERDLHQILLTVHHAWHVIASPSPKILRELLPAHVWDLYGDSLMSSFKLSINAHTLLTPSACDDCDSAKLAQYCSLPAIVIVENRHSDGAFLHMVCDVIRPVLRRHLSGARPQIDVRTAGGIGEVPKELELLGREYSRLRPTGGSVPQRIVVFVDGDARRPGEIDSNAQLVLQCAGKLGIPCHVLAKRSIENYATDDVLRAFGNVRKDHRAAVNLILDLDPIARDHYPHKAGLVKTEAHANEDLYGSDIPLGLGLGQGFAGDWFAHFRHQVTAAQLKARDGIDELIRLMDMVEENI